MEKIVLVTGCSHSAGGEQFDRHCIKDYDGFVEKFQNKRHDIIKKEIWAQQASFVINKKEKFKKILVDDQIKFGEIVKRYIRQMEKKYSWPSLLQRELPSFKIINLSENAGSFKLAVKKTLELYSAGISPVLAIHQVPAISRTYFKSSNIYHNALSVDDFKMRSNVFKKNQKYHELLGRNLELYQNLVKRDIDHGYFLKIFKRHLDILERHSKIHGTKSFYITEEPYDFVSKDKTIIDNFRDFRSQYKIGPDKHVIDESFYPILIKKIISKINLEKVNKINNL